MKISRRHDSSSSDFRGNDSNDKYFVMGVVAAYLAGYAVTETFAIQDGVVGLLDGDHLPQKRTWLEPTKISMGHPGRWVVYVPEMKGAGNDFTVRLGLVF